ncbi:MAG: sulfatase-like hydrolase/transferase [Planctomycetota bacterium]
MRSIPCLFTAVLLPAVLKERGYQTAMFGKWHLGLGEPNLPNSRGFEFFHGFLGDMMDDDYYYNHRRHGVNYMRLNSETIDPEGHATDLFTQWTCDWIKQYRDDAPFFIYLAYNAPHSPIQPPEDFLERYRAKHPDVPERRAKPAALIEHMDAGIGRVLAALEETGRAKNTLVIFTSDNGGSIPHGSDNGPLAGGKQDMLEGGRRYQGKPYYCVRHGDWKLLANDASEPYRLYNLADDPEETTDMAGRRPEVFTRLKQALDAHIARCAATPWRAPDGKGPGEID